MKIYPDFSEITQIKKCLCIARVFDDHRSCQKLINYITNIKYKGNIETILLDPETSSPIAAVHTKLL